MNALNNLAAARLKYDGAIPQHILDAAKYGSAIRAQLADHQGQVKFYRDMILQNVKSSKQWLQRGNIAMSQSTGRDAWIYLRGWRHHRKVVEGIKEAIASMVAEEESQEQHEANGQFGVGV